MVTFMVLRLAYDMRDLWTASSDLAVRLLLTRSLECQTKTIKSLKVQFVTRLRGFAFSEDAFRSEFAVAFFFEPLNAC